VICLAKINSNCIHKGKKNVFGRRKVHHFCKTTPSQIIGAAVAAPVAPLYTPLKLERTNRKHPCIRHGKAGPALKTQKLFLLDKY